jgi:hypothetical protein
LPTTVHIIDLITASSPTHNRHADATGPPLPIEEREPQNSARPPQADIELQPPAETRRGSGYLMLWAIGAGTTR